MNYKNIYNCIIDIAKSKNRLKLDKSDPNYIYFEMHHILPKCLGGKNNKENLVLLTPKEHLICHLLLVKIYPESVSIIRAAILLGSDKYGNRIGARQYEWLRKRFSKQPSPTAGKESKRKGRKFGTNSAKGKPNGKKGIPRGRTSWNKGLVSPRKGNLYPQPQVSCMNCRLSGGLTNMKRYHLENCKEYKFGKHNTNIAEDKHA